jgi:hypothetical protein
MTAPAGLEPKNHYTFRKSGDQAGKHVHLTIVDESERNLSNFFGSSTRLHVRATKVYDKVSVVWPPLLFNR